MKLYGKILFLSILLSFACNQMQSSSTPTETLKEYGEAVKSRDLSRVKQTASKKTIQLMEEMASESGLTLEETIKKIESNMPILQNPEIRNEKINGDKATLEVRNRVNDNWKKVEFVKEDGRWKVAAGDMFYDSIEQFGGKMKAVDKEPGNYNKQANR